MTSVLIGESCCVVLRQKEHRTCEYLVRFFSSIWLSTYMFCIFILVFTFELKKSVLIPNRVTVFQACERGTILKLRVYERATVKNSESM